MVCKNNADICQKETKWTPGQLSVAVNVPVWTETDEGMYYSVLNSANKDSYHYYRPELFSYGFSVGKCGRQ